MKVYKPRPGSFAEVKKKMLRTVIPILLVVVSIVVAARLINTSERRLDLFPLIVGLLVGGGVLTFSLRRTLQRQQAQFESYSLTIADHLIGREIANTPTILIYADDIREIIKRRNGSFIVVGKNLAK